ncbi:cytochrome P450 [Microbacterium sp. Mu-80]|uniref:Cytochrome P450 n=1 Tax=Microbacterium bandirmense TaxID=3122050 RepID=A0ABU8L9K1_9MICO
MLHRIADDAPLLFVHGYDLGSRIWSRVRAGARAAPMRLLGHRAMFVRGAEGVRVFYDEERVARHGVMPRFVQETLFGHGSVHSLDGDEHRHRKSTFLRVAYDDAQALRLHPLLEEEWRRTLDEWVEGGDRSAYEAAVGAFGRAGMRWAGLPGTTEARERFAARLAQIVDGFGRPFTPGFAAALFNRIWSDRRASRLIHAVRTGALRPPPGTALCEWAWHRAPDGKLLSSRLAGVELQNSIRPLVAVARFVAFAAWRLHDEPEWRTRIHAEASERGQLVGGASAVAFAQEIRRTAAFVPMLPGRAITDIDLDGQHAPKGGRVVIDILGTDLDEVSWDAPTQFRPERFLAHPDYEAIDAFIPHGGADVATGHRCPGEKLAIAGLSAAIAAMSDPRVAITGRGLDVDRRRLPTMPSSGGCVHAAGAREAQSRKERTRS